MNSNKAMAQDCARKAQQACVGATLLWLASSLFMGIAANIGFRAVGWLGLIAVIPFYVSAMFALKCRKRYPAMWLRRRQEYLDACRGDKGCERGASHE